VSKPRQMLLAITITTPYSVHGPILASAACTHADRIFKVTA
jgi:hypothetical protein